MKILFMVAGNATAAIYTRKQLGTWEKDYFWKGWTL